MLRVVEAKGTTQSTKIKMLKVLQLSDLISQGMEPMTRKI
jgi:hypothetical protein